MFGLDHCEGSLTSSALKYHQQGDVFMFLYTLDPHAAGQKSADPIVTVGTVVTVVTVVTKVTVRDIYYIHRIFFTSERKSAT